MVARVWEEGGIGRAQDFQGNDTTLCGHHHGGHLSLGKHLFKIIECTTLRVKCNVNCGLSVIMIFQWRPINSNEHTLQWLMLIMGEAMCRQRAGATWEISVPLNFAVN